MLKGSWVQNKLPKLFSYHDLPLKGVSEFFGKKINEETEDIVSVDGVSIELGQKYI